MTTSVIAKFDAAKLKRYSGKEAPWIKRAKIRAILEHKRLRPAPLGDKYKEAGLLFDEEKE